MKIRDAEGIFCAKMGSIKDRNGMALTEAEDIEKRWQEYKNCTISFDPKCQSTYNIPWGEFYQ